MLLFHNQLPLLFVPVSSALPRFGSPKIEQTESRGSSEIVLESRQGFVVLSVRVLLASGFGCDLKDVGTLGRETFFLGSWTAWKKTSLIASFGIQN